MRELAAAAWPIRGVVLESIGSAAGGNGDSKISDDDEKNAKKC